MSLSVFQLGKQMLPAHHRRNGLNVNRSIYSALLSCVSNNLTPVQTMQSLLTEDLCGDC